MRFVWLCVGVAVASFLTACGSGSGQETPALIRVVNLSNATVEATLNDQYDTAAVPYPGQSGAASSSIAGQYIQVPPGTYALSVYPSSGQCSGTCPTEGNTVVGLGTADSYTAVVSNRGGSLYAFTIADILSQPANGAVSLAAANMSPDSGPVDIFLVPSSAGYTSVVASNGESLGATFSQVNQIETQSINLTPGTYDIFVTGESNPTDIRIHIKGIELASGTEAVLALTDTPGGSLVNAALIEQGEGAAYYPNSLARVRLFSALTPSSTAAEVAVTAPGATNPGTTQIAGTLPTVSYGGLSTQYVPIDLSQPQGNEITAITVGGTPMTPPSTTLASGQDYTLLVYGPASAPLATLLADDNLISSNLATARLVNAADADGQQMRIDYQGPVNAAYGASSSYLGFTPLVPDTISVSSGDYNQSLSASMVVGKVYSVFVYSLTAPPAITEDR